MKIQYESTIDEAVDTQIRLLKTSSVAKRWKLQGLIWAPILFFVFYFGIPDEKIVKLVFGFFTGIIFVIIYFATYKKTIKKRTRKFLVEQLGTEEPISSEYEFTDENLIFRKLGTEIRFEWDKVEKLIENKNDIEVRIYKGGIAVIPNRIFSGTEQRDELLNFIKNKIKSI
jgi:hypothetical protein